MKWIDLKEQLPEQGQYVLVSNGTVVAAAQADRDVSDWYITYEGHTVSEIWWDIAHANGYDVEWDFDEDTITHWMPLPDPPEIIDPSTKP
jgi:hypothetical protein